MAGPAMEEIGRVSGFFAKPSVAVVELTADLTVGESVYIKGYTTDLLQVVESMQVDRQPVSAARAGQSVGLNVHDRCRRHDVVYRVVVIAPAATR